MVTCPKCGMPINGGQAHCNNCNAQLPPEVLNRVKAEQQAQKLQQMKKTKYMCGKCGSELIAGETVCRNCGVKNKLPATTVVQAKKVNFCHNCGTQIAEGHKFCPSCGTKIVEQINLQQSVQTSAVQTYNTVHKSSVRKVNVQKGRYTGRKWFTKIAYKTYETDVEFFDDKVRLLQGMGFVNTNAKISVEIFYSSIYGVETKNKFSIPNTIIAIIAALLAIAMQVWLAFIPAAILLFIGKTATVTINHSGGKYIVPTEFMSEAEDLRNRINLAISQSRG